MPFPSPHLYLTVHWADQREPDEGGQFGIRFDSPADDVTQAMVDACAPAVQTFWQAPGAKIPAPYRLTYLRLALVGEDGHYVPETFSRDASYGAGVTNSGNTTGAMPLQIACVATLRTERPSGQASTGRVYLPPMATVLGTDGRWLATDVNSRATALATMLTSLNAALVPAPGGLPAIASVFSKGTTKTAAGLRSFITHVQIGTRPDVQRRRAKSMAEVYGDLKVVTHA